MPFDTSLYQSRYCRPFYSSATIIPREGGNTLSLLQLGRGFAILIEDFHAPGPISMAGRVESPPLSFSYCLAGHKRGRVAGRSFDIEPQSSFLFYTDQEDSGSEIEGEGRITVVTILISPSSIKSILGEEYFSVFPELGRISAGRYHGTLCRTGQITPEIFEVLRQVLDGGKTMGKPRLFYASKARELLFHHLARYLEPSASRGRCLALAPCDIRCIKHAARLLSDHMENPPTIPQLSRMAATNEFKLKRGFRQVFGTTVRGYLKEKRIEQASLLLKQGGQNISEVSRSVGYSKTEYFYREFKSRYGITPAVYRKLHRTRAAAIADTA